ncbi:MAG TPA: YiiX/YebB-like N1pC/P60 family cysteine hydrolase [Myxococcota bacterium]|nr:YiiX/YebB-like N1pC/P60 family cysteine hydrolase [Myxococcota bacterium]
MSEDASGPVKFFMRLLLKLGWSVGGAEDDFPRVWGKDLGDLSERMAAGDVVLLGNGGGLSHVAMSIGGGVLIHSMATEQTMRGFMGSFWDMLRRPWWWLTGREEKTGVIRETLAAFLDRYERDAYVVLRRPGLDEQQRTRGVEHLESLVGKAYDYDFSHGDDEYYCSELVVEFFEAALEEEVEVETKAVRVPLLLDRQIIEPIVFLTAGDLALVEASSGAWVTQKEHLEGLAAAE